MGGGGSPCVIFPCTIKSPEEDFCWHQLTRVVRKKGHKTVVCVCPKTFWWKLVFSLLLCYVNWYLLTCCCAEDWKCRSDQWRRYVRRTSLWWRWATCWRDIRRRFDTSTKSNHFVFSLCDDSKQLNSVFLWSPYVIGQTIIFLPSDFYLLSFFSSPHLSSRRLDVYHTSTHGVALVRI